MAVSGVARACAARAASEPASQGPARHAVSDEQHVHELRRHARFVAAEAITGYFGGSELLICDLSPRGLQVEHSEPLRPGSNARVGFRAGDETVAFRAVVAWSRLSKTANRDGKFLYRSGLRLEEEIPDFLRAIEVLESGGQIRLDDGSLERKRRKLEERAQQKSEPPSPFMKIISPQRVRVPDDQVLLVHQARERLRSHPDEAVKWYNQAKYAMASTEAAPLADMNVPHREEVFAVWAYLEKTVDLVTVARAFEVKKAT
jgi:hypothetical protein